MIGAAAFAGVLTRTSSVTLLVTEITGQTNLLLGILLASLCATGIANIFTMSAFNTTLSITNMPYLPFMFKSELYKRRVGEFSQNITYFLEDKMSLFDVIKFFHSKTLLRLDEFIPIVDNLEDRKIIGSVRTQNVLDYLKSVAKEVESELKKSRVQKAMKIVSKKLTSFWTPESVDDTTNLNDVAPTYNSIG